MVLVFLVAAVSATATPLTYQSCFSNGEQFKDETEWVTRLGINPVESVGELHKRLARSFSEISKKISGKNFFMAYDLENDARKGHRHSGVFYGKEVSRREKIELALTEIQNQISFSPEHYELSCFVKDRLWLFAFVVRESSVFADQSPALYKSIEERIKFYLAASAYPIKLAGAGLLLSSFTLNNFCLKAANPSDLVYVDFGHISPQRESSDPNEQSISHAILDMEIKLAVAAIKKLKHVYQPHEKTVYDEFTRWRITASPSQRQIPWLKLQVKLCEMLVALRKARADSPKPEREASPASRASTPVLKSIKLAEEPVRPKSPWRTLFKN